MGAGARVRGGQGRARDAPDLCCRIQVLLEKSLNSAVDSEASVASLEECNAQLETALAQVQPPQAAPVAPAKLIWPGGMSEALEANEAVMRVLAA